MNTNSLLVLSELGESVLSYHAQYRGLGFTSCFVNLDWVKENTTDGEWELHEKYLVEFTKESIASKDYTEIIFSDDLNCRSPFLNQAKALRLKEHGPVDQLSMDPWRTHLCMLSPGEQKLFKILQMMTQEDFAQREGLIKAIKERRISELSLFRQNIMQFELGCRAGKGTVERFLIEYLAELFSMFSPKIKELKFTSGSFLSVLFEFGCGHVLSVTPLIRLPGVLAAVGRTELAFRIMSSGEVDNVAIRGEGCLVPGIFEIFPGQLQDYKTCRTLDDFYLNVHALYSALTLVLPAGLSLLRSTRESRDQLPS